MKFGVVTFPGSNCDQDMMYILRDVMNQEVVHLWHKDSDLQGADMVVLPGGFSFGDYLRSGAISRFSPIMTEVISHANKGGYVLGICNGFQILTEAGLLDGALLHNNNQKFICKNVHLKAISSSAAISAGLNRNEAFKIPIAHGEGRYHASSEVIESLEQNDQVLFKYCNEKGEISGESNPNGSIHNIAGISNKEKNVFGMMPHPERASDDVLSNSEGRNFFESILKHS
ncbi:phosphoribosylformylglycinamidine synthase subunit PurQ [Crocinitomicaceae bacterium]|nr:phosphoribosylformylglycinamidine synthase subunit PurQ [Crocinitomicaceae bacterium]